jgi:hypothetical protein
MVHILGHCFAASIVELGLSAGVAGAAMAEREDVDGFRGAPQQA